MPTAGPWPTAEATEWSQVVALYDQLIERMPTPVVAALNRALAVWELRGPDAALGLLEGLDPGPLPPVPPLPAPTCSHGSGA